MAEPEISDYLRRPLRSLLEYRDDLLGQVNALPLTSRLRPAIIGRIRDIEEQIETTERRIF